MRNLGILGAAGIGIWLGYTTWAAWPHVPAWAILGWIAWLFGIWALNAVTDRSQRRYCVSDGTPKRGTDLPRDAGMYEDDIVLEQPTRPIPHVRVIEAEPLQLPTPATE